MKLAYLILAHRNFSHLVRLIHALSCEDAFIFVHIDKKCNVDIEALKKQVHNNDRVYFINRRNVISWGGFGITEAIISLLKTCLEHGGCDYISVLSGQDFPLSSNAAIAGFLEKNKGREFLEYMELPAVNNWSGNGGMDRYEYYWAVEEMGFHASVQMVEAQKLEKNKRSFPEGLKPYGGSGWFTITQDCAKYLIDFLTKRSDMIAFFRYVLIAEEILFPTLIMNSPFGDNVVNNNLRYIDWKSGPQYPKTLLSADFGNIAESGCLWARKFDDTIDAAIVSLIEKRMIPVSR